MAVGMMLTFFDFRNDVRQLITRLLKHDEIILFIRAEHEEQIKKFTALGFQYRIINEYTAGNKNALATKLFTALRKIPASRENYFLMESFKAAGASTEALQKRAKNIIRLQRTSPKWISYDRYLDMLEYSGKTDLQGITKMIVLTEIYDDLLLSRLIREKVPTAVYVYSWDHACKQVRFSKRLQYMVWHDGIAEDLKLLQGIPAGSIRVTGATQLGYIHSFRERSVPQPRKINCIYFGCGVGLPELVSEEVRVIMILAEHMRQVLPDHTLIVRPYPNLRFWEVYDTLKTYTNIMIDESYRQQDLSVSDADIIHKFELIHQCKAFFHVGTTLGLEACFTSCPSFLLDLSPDTGQPVSLYHFVHQYQNQKYLIDNSPVNTITTENQLREVLANTHDPKYMHLSSVIQSQFEVKSFDALAGVFLEH